MKRAMALAFFCGLTLFCFSFWAYPVYATKDDVAFVNDEFRPFVRGRPRLASDGMNPA